jgi:hypothetical protein
MSFPALLQEGGFAVKHWILEIDAKGLALAVLFALCGASAFADASQQPDAAQTAPRAVRLSFVQGKVKIRPGGAQTAQKAAANTPLFEGAQISTAEDGQAELQLDDGGLVRIAPSSVLTLSVLKQQGAVAAAELRLDQGLAYFELQSNSADQNTVRFGDTTAVFPSFTVMRVNLDNPPGSVAVFSGAAHLERGRFGQADLHSGQSAILTLAKDTGFAVADAIEPDSWDSWNTDRDRLLQAEASRQTAATSGQQNGNSAAWADLDANGNWYEVPGQGYVWAPYAAAAPGWDPYGSGNWVWTPPYGYIWLSDYHWGYLPYQCGLWNYYDFGWGWAPGACNPWWFGSAWVINIGHRPGWYHPPIRPLPRPVPPGGISRQPLRSSATPVIPVQRQGAANAGAASNRTPYAPVTVSGGQVQALRPVNARTAYSQQGAGFQYRAAGSGRETYSGASSQPSAARPSSRLSYPSVNASPQSAAPSSGGRSSSMSGGSPAGGGMRSGGGASGSHGGGGGGKR